MPLKIIPVMLSDGINCYSCFDRHSYNWWYAQMFYYCYVDTVSLMSQSRSLGTSGQEVSANTQECIAVCTTTPERLRWCSAWSSADVVATAMLACPESSIT